MIAVASMSFGVAPSARCQWVQTSGPNVSSVSRFAVIGKNLFAGTSDVGGSYRGSGVFRSTDDGGTWTAVNSGLTDTIVSALAASGTNLFAGTSTGAYLTTNNGAGWTAINTGLPITYVNAFAEIGINGSSRILFAGTGKGLFRSADNGASWTPSSSGLTDTVITALAVIPTPGGMDLIAGVSKGDGGWDGGIFRSTDSGATWSNTDLPSTTVFSLVVIGTNLFAGTYDYVYLSTDNGSSWSYASGGLTNHLVMSLAVSGTDLFAGTGGSGVFLSSDTGASWTRVSTGLNNTSLSKAIRAVSVSGTNLFVGTYEIGAWRRPLSEFDESSRVAQKAVDPSALTLSPNPTNGIVTVHSETSRTLLVVVTNVLGENVLKLSKPAASDLSVDLSMLPSGTYFIKLCGGGSTTTRMIVRE
jgi:photosystem II stability/assembly factor-like uncharacterized protein